VKDEVQVWAELQRRLHAGLSIPNWTVANGYLGDEFQIERVIPKAVWVDTPGAKQLQYVPRVAFAKVLPLWPGYKVGGVRRMDLRITRFSKYVVSILNWLEQEVGEPLGE
jgi:hypothetical protein